MSKKRHDENVKYANKIRRMARPKLRTLLMIQKDQCMDCRERIVDAKLLLRTTSVARVNRQNGTIEYLVPRGHGRWQVSLMATIDHVRRIIDGGGNDISNLEAVCAPCHRKREKLRKDARGAKIRATLGLSDGCRVEFQALVQQ